MQGVQRTCLLQHLAWCTEGDRRQPPTRRPPRAVPVLGLSRQTDDGFGVAEATSPGLHCFGFWPDSTQGEERCEMHFCKDKKERDWVMSRRVQLSLGLRPARLACDAESETAGAVGP